MNPVLANHIAAVNAHDTDAVLATFAVVDEAKHKLSIAPAAVAFDGDAENGWTLTIDDAESTITTPIRHRIDSRMTRLLV